MNKIILISILAVWVFNFNVPAQTEWAPVGATWHYTYSVPFCPWQIWDYSTMESIKDTMINTKPAKKLSFFNPSICSWISTSYIYSDSNRVFYFDQGNDTFHLLYDLNLNAGQSWDIITNNSQDTFTVTVDSTDSNIINSDTLKVQYISSADPLFEFSGKVIDKIGNTGYFFPQIGVCDPGVGGLRCYEDSSLGFSIHDTTFSICDSVYTIFISVNEIDLNKSIHLYPTLFQSSIYIKLDKDISERIRVTIYSINGEIVLSRYIGRDTKLDVSYLNSGIYILEIFGQKKKIIKL